MSETIYDSYTRSLTGIFFTLIAFAIIINIYPLIAIMCLCYLAVVFLFITTLCQFNVNLRHNLVEKFNVITGLASTIGFLAAFAFIVVDFLMPIDPPTLIFALISLILIRQMLAGLSATVNAISGLYAQNLLVNGLFFEGYAKSTQITKQEKQFWSLLRDDVRPDWIKDLLNQIVNIKCNNIKSQWYEMGINGVVVFDVCACCDDGIDRRFFVKIFNSNHIAQARNEETILEVCDLSFVALDYHGSTQLEKYHCHIFSHDEITGVSIKDIPEQKLNLMKMLMSYNLPEELISRYTRTHPYLWQRLNKEMIRRLNLAANDTQLKQLSIVEAQFENIITSLSTVPLYLQVLRITPDTLFRTKKGELRLMHMTDWKIEPIGFGWPVKKDKLDLLSDVLDGLVDSRPDLKGISVGCVFLTALFSQFESLYISQKYSFALELLPQIIECLENICDE